jgi:hypothetical protein
LEARLKTLAAVERLEAYAYGPVIDRVFGLAGSCGQDSVRATALKNLFALRNRIAHDGLEPEAQDVARYLELVRDTFDVLA